MPDGQESWRAGAAVMFGYWFSFRRYVFLKQCWMRFPVLVRVNDEHSWTSRECPEGSVGSHARKQFTCCPCIILIRQEW